MEIITQKISDSLFSLFFRFIELYLAVYTVTCKYSVASKQSQTYLLTKSDMLYLKFYHKTFIHVVRGCDVTRWKFNRNSL